MFSTAMAWLESMLGCVVSASGQAAVLAGVVLLLVWALRGQLLARWRFALWLLVFVRLALLMAPPAPWSVIRVTPSVKLDSWVPAPAPDVRQQAAVHPPYASEVPVVVPNAVETVVARHAEPASWSLIPVVSLLWLGGVAFVTWHLACVVYRLARQRRSWRTVSDANLLALFQACRAELGIVRTVELLVADQRVGPATCGVFRPCIVLPQDILARLSREELRLVLLHELIHVRRWDVLLDHLVLLVTAVHWFNPLAWLALGCLRRERELACDAAVLEQIGADEAAPYGRVILKVVEQMLATAPLPGAVGVFGRVGSFTRRIHMIAGYRKATAAGTILGCGLLLLLAAVGLTDALAEPPPPAAGKADTPREPGAKQLTLAGRCQTEDGKPLPDVRVSVYRVDYRQLTTERVREQTTGAEGTFRFADLPAPPRNGERSEWHYALVCVARGLASTIHPFNESRSGDNATIKLPAAATLRGRVTDPAGKPIVGAQVWVNGLLTDPLEGVQSARTDADGRYAILDLPAWDVARLKPTDHGDGTMSVVTGCYFSVRHPDYGHARPIYQRVPDSIDVTLQPAGVIEGRVLDQVTSRPAAGIVVSMQGTDANRDGGWHQTRTDAEGKYRLTSLVAGKYNLWAQAADRACAAVDSFAVTAGKVHTAPDLKLQEGGWIEGRLVDAATGKPISRDDKSGQRLAVGLYGPSRPKSGAACQSAPVDDQGTFRLHVAPGVNYPYIMYTDVWQRTQRHEFYEQGIEVKPREVVQVSFRILPQKPLLDPDPDPVRLPLPIAAEQAAAATIRQLGGWYQLDKDGHVIEVNMVYHETPAGQRFDNNRTDTDAALRAVPAFPRLKRLFLHKKQATDDGLKSVAGLQHLEVLMIWDAEAITDAGVKHLEGLKSLNNLHIGEGQLGDDALAVLARMPGLRHLSLQHNAFTDAGVEHIGKMKELQTLWIGLSRGRITDAGVRRLSGLTSLTQLDLQGAQLTDEGVAALKGLTKLKMLYLSSQRKGEQGITDASVPVLLGLSKLEQMGLQNTRFTSQGVLRLLELPALKNFSLELPSSSEELRNEMKKRRPDVRFSFSTSVSR